MLLEAVFSAKGKDGKGERIQAACRWSTTGGGPGGTGLLQSVLTTSRAALIIAAAGDERAAATTQPRKLIPALRAKHGCSWQPGVGQAVANALVGARFFFFGASLLSQLTCAPPPQSLSP